MEPAEKMYWMALQKEIKSDIFPIARKLIDYYGSLAEFWHKNDSIALPELSEIIRQKLILARQHCRPHQLWEECSRKKIGVVCCLEESYPKELLHFSGYPVILYYYGKKALWHQPAAAIVGSRRSTAYGRQLAEVFASALARAGFCIVSGMAKGIDAVAHESALAAGGDSIAVLGCGVDVPYPPENRRLYWRLREEGLIISEYFPGEKPLAWHFPQRNRLISALGRFLLLVEGEARSGALITCQWAAEQGKDVWALPGPVTNPSSIGPLQLIQDGAQLAITPEDILRAYLPAVYGVAAAGHEEDNSESGEINYQTAKLRENPKSDPKLNPKSNPKSNPKANRASNLQLNPPSRPSQQQLFLSQKEALTLVSPAEKKIFQDISYSPVHIDTLLTDHPALAGDVYLGLTNLLALRLIEKLPGDYYQRI